MSSTREKNSLQTYYPCRREKICSSSNRSFDGRDMTFLFCKGHDIIFALTSKKARLDNFSQYAILMSAPKTDRMAVDVLKDI